MSGAPMMPPSTAYPQGKGTPCRARAGPAFSPRGGKGVPASFLQAPSLSSACCFQGKTGHAVDASPQTGRACGEARSCILNGSDFAPPSLRRPACGEMPHPAWRARAVARAPRFIQMRHFQFETLCVSNHTACRFAEKAGFSAHFGPGGAVTPPRVLPFSKAKRSSSDRSIRPAWGRRIPRRRPALPRCGAAGCTWPCARSGRANRS